MGYFWGIRVWGCGILYDCTALGNPNSLRLHSRIFGDLRLHVMGLGPMAILLIATRAPGSGSDSTWECFHNWTIRLDLRVDTAAILLHGKLVTIVDYKSKRCSYTSSLQLYSSATRVQNRAQTTTSQC